MFLKTFLVSILLFSQSVFGLEINEQLKVRIIILSSTKKTMLLNRGMEDGLKVGDHGKFFLTTGVVARGVLRKASPSRSIWAIYQSKKPELLTSDKNVNLRISEPLVISDDELERLADAPSEQYLRRQRLADGIEENKEKAILTDKNSRPPKFADRPFVGRNLLEEERKPTLSVGQSLALGSYKVSGDYSVEESSYMWTTTLEKMFLDKKGRYKGTSLIGVFELDNYSNSFGIGANFYNFENDIEVDSFVSFFQLAGGVSSYNYSDELIDAKASGLFYYAGIGGKYLFKSGLGLNAVAQYYTMNLKAVVTTTREELESTIKITGPRFLVGLSYLF